MIIRVRNAVFCLLCFIAMVSVGNATDEGYIHKQEDYTNVVVLQALNKVTARVSSVEVMVGEKESFGNVDIVLEKCWRSPPEEQPENKALLKLWEQVPGEEKRNIFYGWMLSSSPTVSALEHPVYDITVIECKNVDVVKG